MAEILLLVAWPENVDVEGEIVDLLQREPHVQGAKRRVGLAERHVGDLEDHAFRVGPAVRRVPEARVSGPAGAEVLHRRRDGGGEAQRDVEAQRIEPVRRPANRGREPALSTIEARERDPAEASRPPKAG